MERFAGVELKVPVLWEAMGARNEVMTIASKSTFDYSTLV
jgi:hypothetical protein